MAAAEAVADLADEGRATNGSEGFGGAVRLWGRSSADRGRGNGVTEGSEVLYGGGCGKRQQFYRERTK
ncbi:hypothetical protein [Halococcus agarilyticus]|uniref:hypothetical protein n=1 Tax=Halococcus agarilyticus TaxID=1232219 RepID=UPI000AEA19D8|nr:hypothetical protein [Halococcus agarilyticus]